MFRSRQPDEHSASSGNQCGDEPHDETRYELLESTPVVQPIAETTAAAISTQEHAESSSPTSTPPTTTNSTETSALKQALLCSQPQINPPLPKPQKKTLQIIMCEHCNCIFDTANDLVLHEVVKHNAKPLCSKSPTQPYITNDPVQLQTQYLLDDNGNRVQITPIVSQPLHNMSQSLVLRSLLASPTHSTQGVVQGSHVQTEAEPEAVNPGQYNIPDAHGKQDSQWQARIGELEIGQRDWSIDELKEQN